MEQLNEVLDKYKIPLVLSLVGIVLIIGGVFSSGVLNNKPKVFPKESIVQASPLGSQIKVDVSGAVNNPAVYALSSNSRVEDAVKVAGGFSSSASAEYISKGLNMSQKISDGMKIYIPFEGDPAPYGAGQGLVAGAATGGKIGVNNGTQSQLESLPGVGPATAIKIIAARPYQDILELRTKKAVSKAVFEKIKDLVDLN